jgi:hypothetical protein
VSCKIHAKRPEEDAETTVMKAQESDGQQKPAERGGSQSTRENDKVNGEVQNSLETTRRGCRNNSYESARIGRPAKAC